MELALIKKPASLQTDAPQPSWRLRALFSKSDLSQAEGYIKHMEIYHPAGKPQLAS